MKLSVEEIKVMKKHQFRKIIKNSIKEKALRYLMEKEEVKEVK